MPTDDLPAAHLPTSPAGHPAVTTAIADDVVTITLDDGKANALAPAVIDALARAVTDASDTELPLVLAGRPGVFSAGFHLPTLTAGGPPAVEMLISGFRLAAQLLDHPRPVVVACTGHAYAMGTFLLLTGDVRVGCRADARIAANEVAIGLTMPWSAIEILRLRLTPAAFDRAVVTAQPFDPTQAIAAGLVDTLADSADVVPTARGVAAQLGQQLHPGAHAASKRRARQHALQALGDAIERDRSELTSLLAAAPTPA